MRRKDTFELVACQLITILICLVGNAWAGLDAPHDTSTGTGCLSCHQMNSTYPNLLPPLNHTPLPGDLDDTASNGLCWSCHNETIAPNVKTHSSLTSDNSYGYWTVECWVCHNQHLQEQKYNDSTYGKFIRRAINLANIKGGDGNTLGKTGIKSVKFLGQTGANSYADGDPAAIDGICEVCHTQTSHWSPAAPENDNHYAGQNCMGCHNHSNGFVHGGGGGGTNCADCHNTGDHPIHLLKGITCEQCHGNASFINNGNVQFADSQLFAGTTVCAACHSAKPGWGETATACLSCHKIAQGNRTAVGAQFQGNSHHIQGIEVADYHCYECHWEARRVDGVVAGKIDVAYHGGQVEPGAAVNLVIYGAGVRPDSYQSATAIQYLADGSRTEIEKLNGHCLGCHSDQNNTTQPFGDGKTPKNYAWDGTSVDARYSDPGTTTWGKYSGSYVSQKSGITKAFSAHGNAPANQGGYAVTKDNGFIKTESWPNTRGGSVKVTCFDCHNSHGSAVSGTTTSYTGTTINGGLFKNTIAGKGGYATDYTPASGGSQVSRNQYNAGADLCFDCHLTENEGHTPWGYKSTFGATQPVNGFSDSARFGSEGDIRNTHAGGHFGASQSLTTPASGSINGLCTPCHDPHGVSPTIAQNYGVPLLKGTWLTSPYQLDKPKAIDGPSGSGGGIGVLPSADPPVYKIDQNTFAGWDFTSTAGIAEAIDNFGGLCLKCHPKSSIDRDATATWRTMDRVHETVKGWGANSKHSFPCAKCHTPHATERLPKLMVTNCLNSKHKGRKVNNLNPQVQITYSFEGASGSGSGSGKYAAGGQGSAGKVGFGLGISCHDNIGTGTYPDKNLWNNVTPWLDQDYDESYYYTANPASANGDCDDTNAAISRALDGTCDGDSDGIFDASAGGTDCNDNNNSIGYQPAVCDKDGDTFIDPSFGGYDCDDNNTAIGIAEDGICDSDGDGAIDWTAGGPDCLDNDPLYLSMAADGTCDGDNDGLFDVTAGGSDCNDSDANIKAAIDGTCDGDNDGFIDTSARTGDSGMDCDDTDSSITFAADNTCDGDNDGFIDLTAGGSDCNDSYSSMHNAPDGTCDGDGDGLIDADAVPSHDSGLDCDDDDPVVKNPTDGNCDNDNDGFIDPTALGSDCNDLNASVTAATDGTCDGDADGYIDGTAGGNDCDDAVATVTMAPDSTCDGDNDGYIDWMAGGVDCLDNNAAHNAAADATCDGDSDGFIDFTAGGSDCNDSNADINAAADGTCDSDNDGFIDPSAGGNDCDDNNNGVGYVAALCDADGDTYISTSYGGLDCKDTNASIKKAADGSCDGDSDNYIDWTAGGNDCNDTNGGIIPPCDLSKNSTSYTANTLTDTTADWPANVFAGRVITYQVTQIITPWPWFTFTQHFSTRTIISNTKTTITVNSNWDFPTGYIAGEYKIRLN
ncbi:MAG: cytochrome c3 family protein [Desulfobulbaceae bacterium]